MLIMDDDTFTICSAKFLLSPYRFRIFTHLENRRLNEWMNERETRDGAIEREKNRWDVTLRGEHISENLTTKDVIES